MIRHLLVHSRLLKRVIGINIDIEISIVRASARQNSGSLSPPLKWPMIERTFTHLDLGL